MPAGWVSVLQDGSQESHLVHLYREDGALARAVATWAGHALASGGAAILIGTPPHLQAIARKMVAAGLDPGAAERSGRLQRLDAEACMDRFMRGGAPDPEAFHALVGEAMAAVRATRPEGPVRAWGEMVNLLTTGGNPGAAMALEELWNEAVAKHRFRLLCSYTGDPFDPALYTSRHLQVVAHGHGRLFPLEDPHLFDRAVDMAMHQVCGAQAEPLRDVLAKRRVEGLDVAMPPAHHLLAAMNHVLPDYGRKLAARAAANYRAAALA